MVSFIVYNICKYSVLFLQDPQEVKLGRKMVLAHRVARPYLKVVHEVVYHVPLIESLQRLLKQPMIFCEVIGTII